MRKIEALVHSSEQRTHIRKGRGFSRNELKEAGLTLHDARMFKIPVDKRRRSSHPENVETLKESFKKKPVEPKPEKVVERKPKKSIKKEPKKITTQKPKKVSKKITKKSKKPAVKPKQKTSKKKQTKKS